MVLQQKPERQLIEDALAAGRLSVPDEHGFHHGMYAVCSEDGVRAHPDRTIWKRDLRGHYIESVIVRCYRCGRRWQASSAEIHLA